MPVRPSRAASSRGAPDVPAGVDGGRQAAPAQPGLEHAAVLAVHRPAGPRCPAGRGWPRWSAGTRCCARPTPSGATRPVQVDPPAPPAAGHGRVRPAPRRRPGAPPSWTGWPGCQHGLALDHARGPLLTRHSSSGPATDDAYLLVTIDHAVCDGWAVGVLRAELAAAYAGAGDRAAGCGSGSCPCSTGTSRPGSARTPPPDEYDGQLDWWAGRLDPGALGLAAAVPVEDVPGFTGVRYRLVVPAASGRPAAPAAGHDVPHPAGRAVPGRWPADRDRRRGGREHGRRAQPAGAPAAGRDVRQPGRGPDGGAGRRHVRAAARPGPGRRGRGRHPAGGAVAAGRRAGRRRRGRDLAQRRAAAVAGPVPRRRGRHRRAAAGLRDRRAGGGLAGRDARLHSFVDSGPGADVVALSTTTPGS